MNSYEEMILDIHSVRTRVLRGGSGPALVYWHGAGGAGRWFPHHALLADHFTVYAPDHPGWGGSDTVEWMDTMQDYVLHHDSVLRSLGLEQPVLVAHSLGGWMAAMFAATYPDRLSALALVNAAGMPATEESIPDFFACVARGGEELARLLFHKPEAAAAYYPAQPTAEDRLRVFHEMTSTARIAWNRWFEDKMAYRLPRITTPTLVLWGARERLFPVALGRRYADAIPGAEFQVMENCGHMLPFEEPAAFVQAILRLHSRATGSRPEEGEGR